MYRISGNLGIYGFWLTVPHYGKQSYGEAQNEICDLDPGFGVVRTYDV